MVNKRVTPKEDPLIQVIFLIKKTQKKFLDDLGKSQRSAHIRTLIDAQMNTHAAEIISLKDELRHHEAQQNIIKAQISELEEETQKKQTAGKNRQMLLDDISNRLAKNNKILDFSDRHLKRVLKTVSDDANKNLNSGEPITEAEIKELTIIKARGLGRTIYD